MGPLLKELIALLSRTLTGGGILFSLGRICRETAGTAGPVTVGTWFRQKIMGKNAQAYWPTSPQSTVCHARRVRTGIGTAPGLSPGCYIQARNGIEIGDYTLVAPNVGLISSNHSPLDLSQHEDAPPIRIGRYCWLGMNSVVLPGVELGDHTVVAANTVVNTSFSEGYCILAGAPARVVRKLEQAETKEAVNEVEYIGYHALRGRSAEEVFTSLGIKAQK